MINLLSGSGSANSTSTFTLHLVVSRPALLIAVAVYQAESWLTVESILRAASPFVPSILKKKKEKKCEKKSSIQKLLLP